MKVIIAGSRDIEDYEKVKRVIEISKFRNSITEIVSGHARGIDKLGERFGEEYSIPVKIFPAEWKRLGKAAGFIRNEQMGNYADAAIIIWDGKSNGTKQMKGYMELIGKPYELILWDYVDQYILGEEP